MLTKNTLTKFSFNRHLYFVAFYLILCPTVVWWRYYYKKIADETVQIVHRFWTYWMHKYNTATLRKILRIKIIIIFKWTVIELSTIVTTSQTIASYDSNMFLPFSKNNVPANIPEWYEKVNISNTIKHTKYLIHPGVVCILYYLSCFLVLILKVSYYACLWRGIFGVEFRWDLRVSTWILK